MILLYILFRTLLHREINYIFIYYMYIYIYIHIIYIYIHIIYIYIYIYIYTYNIYIHIYIYINKYITPTHTKFLRDALRFIRQCHAGASLLASCSVSLDSHPSANL